MKSENISYKVYLNLRYEGTDTAIMTLKPDDGDYLRAFVTQYKSEYGFVVEVRVGASGVECTQGRPIVVDDVRVRAVGQGSKISVNSIPPATSPAEPASHSLCYFEGRGRISTPVYLLGNLKAGHEISGPSIVIDNTSTIIN